MPAGAAPRDAILYPARTKVKDHPPMTALLCDGAAAQAIKSGCTPVPGAEAVYFGADQPRITAEMLIPVVGARRRAAGARRGAQRRGGADLMARERWMSLSGRAPERRSPTRRLAYDAARRRPRSHRPRTIAPARPVVQRLVPPRWCRPRFPVRFPRQGRFNLVNQAKKGGNMRKMPIARPRNDIAARCRIPVGCPAAGAGARAAAGHSLWRAIGLEAAKKAMPPPKPRRRRTIGDGDVILDSTGHVVMLHKLDNTQYGSIQVAEARPRQRSISAGRARFSKPGRRRRSGLRNPALHGATPLEGGVPIIATAKVIGAVGVPADLTQTRRSPRRRRRCQKGAG